MSVVRATVRDGKIVADAPADWPEGMPVEVLPAGKQVGVKEDEQADSPEAIEEWVRWYDSLEPLILTAEDEARIAEARRERREWFFAHAEDRDRKLREMFE